MAHVFKTLVEFLDLLPTEVEGRARVDPPEDSKEKIRAFARGELKDPERGELIQLLKENPHWIPFLVEEAKALRATAKSGKPPGQK